MAIYIIIKCVIEIKQWVWWVQSTESMGGYIYFIKYKNDIHPPVPRSSFDGILKRV